MKKLSLLFMLVPILSFGQIGDEPAEIVGNKTEWPKNGWYIIMNYTHYEGWYKKFYARAGDLFYVYRVGIGDYDFPRSIHLNNSPQCDVKWYEGTTGNYLQWYWVHAKYGNHFMDDHYMVRWTGNSKPTWKEIQEVIRDK